jgi:hypothetical protein
LQSADLLGAVGGAGGIEIAGETVLKGALGILHLGRQPVDDGGLAGVLQLLET